VDGNTLTLDGVVLRPDGGARLTASGSIALVELDRGARLVEAEALGATVATRLLAGGAAELAPLGALGTLGRPGSPS
jgi:hypothetical protein